MKKNMVNETIALTYNQVGSNRSDLNKNKYCLLWFRNLVFYSMKMFTYLFTCFEISTPSIALPSLCLLLVFSLVVFPLLLGQSFLVRISGRSYGSLSNISFDWEFLVFVCLCRECIGVG